MISFSTFVENVRLSCTLFEL